MRFHDTVLGLFTLIVGVAVGVYAWGFPAAAGQAVGPGAFPVVLGGGLAVGGLLLLASGRRSRGVPWLVVEPWLRRLPALRNAALVVGGLLAYALVVETAGFFLTAGAFLVVLFTAFGVSRRWILPLAVGATLAIHGAFYSLLRVPLPWGWLEGIAW